MRAAIVLSLVLAVACAPGPTSTTPTGAPATPSGGTPAPTSSADGQAQDRVFRVTVHVGRQTYRTTEAIDLLATLTYLGPDSRSVVVGSGSGLVGFTLRQLDGHLEIGWAMTSDCHIYSMDRDVVVPTQYVKSGGFADTDPDAAFMRAFLADKLLHLPAGTWQVDAVLDAYVGSCGGERHQLTASALVQIVP